MKVKGREGVTEEMLLDDLYRCSSLLLLLLAGLAGGEAAV